MFSRESLKRNQEKLHGLWYMFDATVGTSTDYQLVMKLFAVLVTCNPPCENGRCIDNSTNSTMCYCEIGWEGQFCNKTNGGESQT